ncbi:MAG: sensor histidine kinase, partial [Spirochaetia bacterium]
TITGETISLEFSLQKELKPVLIDPNQLKQCIINLALNARDSMPGGGSLSVATYLRKVSPRDRDPKHKEMQQGEYSCIKIEDTGHGMNTEVIEHIFEPFYTTKDQGKGTGLGLAMIYGFIKQSKGYIYAESVIGKGTAFYIYLPAA